MHDWRNVVAKLAGFVTLVRRSYAEKRRSHANDPALLLQLKSRQTSPAYEAASGLIARYAPIFVSKVLSLFAVDGVANLLKRKPQCSGLSFEIFPDTLFD